MEQNTDNGMILGQTEGEPRLASLLYRVGMEGPVKQGVILGAHKSGDSWFVQITGEPQRLRWESLMVRFLDVT